MAISTLTSKGQLTLPKSIRDYLGVDEGDKIEFIINEAGHVLVSPRTLNIDDIFGMIDKPMGITVEALSSFGLQFMNISI